MLAAGAAEVAACQHKDVGERGRVNDDARSQAGLGSLLVTARCSEDYWTGTGEPVELGATRRRESRETTLSGSAGHELLCMT